MPEISTLALFATAALVLTATPGPDMLLIASRSLSQGRSAGFLTYFGIALGTCCHATAAALGLAQLLKTVPVAYEVVRWAGCAYLLYLAFKTLRSKASAFTPTAGLDRMSRLRVFSAGVGTNLLNPKMALFVLALFPQFTSADRGPLLAQMLILATVLNCVGLAVNGTVILTVSHARRRFRLSSRYVKLPQQALAMVFAGLAFRLAVSSRP